jgi:hypothetical protein
VGVWELNEGETVTLEPTPIVLSAAAEPVVPAEVPALQSRITIVYEMAAYSAAVEGTGAAARQSRRKVRAL